MSDHTSRSKVWESSLGLQKRDFGRPRTQSRVAMSSRFLGREVLGNVGAARAREPSDSKRTVTLVLLPAGSRNLSPFPDPSVRSVACTAFGDEETRVAGVCVCVLKTSGCSGDVAHAKGRVRNERKQEPYTFSQGPEDFTKGFGLSKVQGVGF